MSSAQGPAPVRHDAARAALEAIRAYAPTITVPPSVNAKTAQKHDYPSPEHRRSYARRSAAERTYATVKDPASNDLSRGWCRLTGLAPVALFAPASSSPATCASPTPSPRGWPRRSGGGAAAQAAQAPPANRRGSDRHSERAALTSGACCRKARPGQVRRKATTLPAQIRTAAVRKPSFGTTGARFAGSSRRVIGD